MRFIKINPFGVYVAPISVMMVAAWVVTIGLRRSPPVLVFCAMFWQPAAFVVAVHMIVRSSIATHRPASSPAPRSRFDLPI